MSVISQIASFKPQASELSFFHARLLRLMLIGIVAFNFADYFLTRWALDMGYRELNPFLDPVVETPIFPLVKFALVPLALFAVWRWRQQVGPRILYYVSFAFICYLLLMFHFKLHLWAWALI